jgi:Holliday junction resolvase RusA-like endonuclease
MTKGESRTISHQSYDKQFGKKYDRKVARYMEGGAALAFYLTAKLINMIQQLRKLKHLNIPLEFSIKF